MISSVTILVFERTIRKKKFSLKYRAIDRFWFFLQVYRYKTHTTWM